MQVPNPLGGYPLTLREDKITEGRPGELLFDYTDNKIYYIDVHDNTHVELAKRIYDKIIAARLENNKIFINKESNIVSSEEDIIPEPKDRPFNTWYMNIYHSTPIGEDPVPTPSTKCLIVFNLNDFDFDDIEIIVDVLYVPAMIETFSGTAIGNLDAPSYRVIDYNGHEVTNPHVNFVGWKDQNTGVMVTADTIVTEDMYLDAVFAIEQSNECSIHFEFNPYQDFTEFGVEVRDLPTDMTVESGTTYMEANIPFPSYDYYGDTDTTTVIGTWVINPQENESGRGIPISDIQDPITQDVTLYTYFTVYHIGTS